MTVSLDTVNDIRSMDATGRSRSEIAAVWVAWMRQTLGSAARSAASNKGHRRQ